MPCRAGGSLLGGSAPRFAVAGARRARCPRRAPGTAPCFSPPGSRGGAASAVRCFGSRGAAVRAERELCRAPHLRRGAPRGGERSPGRCAARRREAAGSSPARSPSRPLPPVRCRGLRGQNPSSLRESLMFAKCLISNRVRGFASPRCRTAGSQQAGVQLRLSNARATGQGAFLFSYRLVRFVGNI